MTASTYSPLCQSPCDTQRQLLTPEGVEVNLRLAGPVVRGAAWMMDFLLRAVLFWILAMLISAQNIFGRATGGILLLVLFFLEWVYPVLWECLYQGATPGKKMFGLAVLHDDGTPVRWRASILRNFLRVVDFLPLFNGFGVLSSLLNRDFKRLGDLAAGTVVVYSEKVQIFPELLKTQRDENGLDLSKIPLDGLTRPLTPEERKALVDFADRAVGLTPDRADELAELLWPVIAAEGVSPPIARNAESVRVYQYLLARARQVKDRQPG